MPGHADEESSPTVSHELRALLGQVEDLGILLELDGNELVVNAAPGVVTSAWRARLAAAKPALVEHLRKAQHANSVLSFAQEGAWLLTRLHPNSPVGRLVLALSLDGHVDAERLRAAFAGLVGKHAILRTRFPSDTDGPRVVVEDTIRDVFEEASVPDEDETRRLFARLADAPFDLEQGPLLRACLATWGPRKHAFLLVANHLVADGETMYLLWSELSARYLASATDLGESTSYVRHAARERIGHASGEMEDALAYWRRTLEGVPVLDLPVDHRRAAKHESHGSRFGFELSGDAWAGLLSLAREEHVSPFVAGLALFQAALSRFSNAEDIPVGTPFANRAEPQTRSAIGYFANVCVLRGDLSGSPSMRELLRRTRALVLDAMDHQHAPLYLVQRDFTGTRDLAQEPLFRVFFTHSRVTKWGRLGEAQVCEMPLANQRAGFDIELSITEHSAGARAQLEYSTELFEHGTMEALGEALGVLLEGVVHEPDRAIAKMDLLSVSARDQVQTWSRGPAVGEPARPLHIHFAEVAARAPERLAVWSATGQASFGDLHAQAQTLSAVLLQHGIAPGDLVAVVLERGTALPAALMGVLASGAAFLALDIEHPRARLHELLQDARPRKVVALRNVLTDLELDDNLVVAWDELPPNDSPPRMVQVAPESPAYGVYTSGSTGRPMGVVSSHLAAWSRYSWAAEAFPFEPNEVLCQRASLSFVDGIYEVLIPLFAGVPQVVISTEIVRDPRRFVRALAEAEVTRVVLVPAILRSLLDSGELLGRRVPHLRFCICSGEPLAPSLARRFRTACPGVRLLNLYGTAEVAADATWHEVRDVSSHGLRVPVGRPLAGFQVRVVGAHGELLPPAFPGEIHIGGVGVAQGYRGHPVETGERFGLVDGVGRVFRSGDRGRWRADGTLELLGRIDTQVKCNGVRIELQEVEAVLQDHAAIAVAGCAFVDGGDHPPRLVALAVALESSNEMGQPGTRTAPLEEDLRAFVGARLPRSHVPARILLVRSLPFLSSGKIDRGELGQRALATLDEVGPGADSAPTEAPSTRTEVELAAAWQELLQSDVVSRHTNFFALGGHSLAIGRLQRMVAERLQKTLLFHEVFDHADLASLAGHLDAKEKVAAQIEGDVLSLRDQDDSILSFAQERFWILNGIEPRSVAYNLAFPLHLEGALDVDALGNALDEIVSRHAPLRTTFPTEEGRAFAQIEAPAPVGLPVVEISGSNLETVADQKVDELIARDLAQPFDLSHGPLARFTLLKVGPEEHVLLSTFHHIICDKWSFGIYFDELAQLYSAAVRSEVSPLKPPVTSYGAYARRQRLRHAHGSEESLRFWQAYLKELPVLSLPTDRPRPRQRGLEGRRRNFVVPAPTVDGLRTLAAAEDATLFTVLCAGFALLLGRHSGQTDVVLGTPVAGRDAPGTEALIGMFVNSVVLRFKLDGAASLRDVARRVRRSSLGALSHGSMPFEALVSALEPTRDPGRNPLFQVLFNLVPETDRPQLAGLEATFVEQEITTSIFDLSLMMADTRAGLIGTFEYDRALFDSATIERFEAHFLTLLSALANTPEDSPWDVALATPIDDRLMAEYTRGIPAQVQPPQRLEQRVSEQARIRPNAPAICSDQGSLTYRELEARSNRIAGHLTKRGIQPDDLVVVGLSRSPDLVATLLAVSKCGATWVPVDPAHPDARIQSIVRSVAPACFVTEGRWKARFGSPAQACALDLEADEVANCPPEAPILSGSRGVDELVYVIHTSGSTGTPKGVAVEHASLSNTLASCAARPGFTADDSLLAITTPSFDMGVLELFLPLVVGGSVVLAPEEVARDGWALLDRIQSSSATVLQATPSTWRLLLEAGWPGRANLRAWCGGEELPRALAQALSARCDEVWNLYGPTEAAIYACVKRVTPGDGPVPLGKPIAGTHMRVLNADRRPTLRGGVGELYLGGVGLARGYWNDEKLTDESFVEDPIRPGQRLFATRDRVRFDASGELIFLGRGDRQLKLNGVRVEPAEIEAALDRVLAPRERAVVPVDGPLGKRRLIAHVVTSEAIDEKETRALLRKELPEALVPWRVVRHEHLPRTANGKLDWKRIQGWQEPSIGKPCLAPETKEPWTHTEKRLAGLVAEVLGLGGPDDVRRETDFFDLGGDSLMAMRLVFRIEEEWDTRIPVSKLFEADFQELAHAVEEGSAGSPDRVSDSAPLAPMVGKGTPLSPEQLRFWLAGLAGGSSYNVPLVLRLSGPLDLEALDLAWRAVLEQHALLRARFPLAGKAPIQRLLPPGELDVEHLQIAANEFDRELQHQLLRTFDLETGPVARATLLALGPYDHVFLLVAHHVVLDETSVSIVRRDLLSAYDALLRSRPPRLRPGVLPYSVHAQSRLARLQRDEDRLIAYWKTALAGATAPDLPISQSPPAGLERRARFHEVELPLSLGAEADALAQRSRATPFQVWLSIAQLSIAKWCGASHDFLIGLPVANRQGRELEEVVGPFVNTLLLRTTISTTAGFLEVLRDTQRNILDGMAHVDLPFDRLVAGLNPARGADRDSLLRVLVQENQVPLSQAVGLLQVEELGIQSVEPKVELVIGVGRGQKGWQVAMEFDGSLFDEGACEGFAALFVGIAENALRSPNKPISEYAE